MLNGFDITGNVEIKVYDKTGLIQVQQVKNLVVARGVEVIRDRILGSGSLSSASISHFAVGISDSPVNSSQVKLVSQVTSGSYVRGAVTKSSAAGVAILTYVLPSGTVAEAANGNTLTEIGIFTASTGDTLFARALLATPIIKDSSKSASFEWRINIGAL